MTAKYSPEGCFLGCATKTLETESQRLEVLHWLDSLTINWQSMAVAAHGCPPAHTHVPAAWTLGAAVLPLGRSLCMPAKQSAETRNQSDAACTSDTQTPPPSSRRSINRTIRAQKRRGFLAPDGFSRGCSVKKRQVARPKVDSLGAMGHSLKAHTPPLTLSIYTTGFAPTSVLH